MKKRKIWIDATKGFGFILIMVSMFYCWIYTYIFIYEVFLNV